MPAVLNEHDQWVDSAGKPFVNGTVAYGVQGADPDVSPIIIYSDRELTTVITNPQVLDANGRTANKVWVAGRYSILVKDLNAAQVYTNLDNGETADKGITVLENVSGGNTIVATAASTITAYEDLEQYTFRTVSVNTAAVTLNIDTVGAKSIVKNHDQAILPGEFEADQNIVVSYNLTDDVFEWTNQNVKNVAFYEGTPVASAATTNIWVDDGNTVHVTGVVTITSFGTAPNIGAWKKVIFDGILTLTDGANLNLPGGVNITTAVDDFAFVYAETATLFKVLYFKADGTAVIASAPNGWEYVSTVTAAASADVQFTGFETGYDYMVTSAFVQPATDAVQFRAEFGITGPTYRTSGYLGNASYHIVAGVGGTNETTHLVLSGVSSTMGTGTDEFGGFNVTLLDPAAATDTYYKHEDAWRVSNASLANGLGGGFHSTAEAITAIKFYFSAGNIATGEFKLYRRPNA